MDIDWSLQENCRALLCIENGKEKHCGDVVMGKVRYCTRHSQKTSTTEKNPAHFCMGDNCNKFLGHRGFCSTKCHDSHYDGMDS